MFPYLANLAMGVLLLAHLSVGGERCIGEFVLDPDVGECVLAANGGDPDEPLASDSRCRPDQFRCPGLGQGRGGSGGQCVDTPAEYAACATGRGEFLSIADEETTTASPPCHAPRSGLWSCGGVNCTMSVDGSDPDSFTVTAVGAPAVAWKTGKGTVEGDGTLLVRYDIPTGDPWRRGQPSSCCPTPNVLTWNDSSVWRCLVNCSTCPPTPPSERLDIHIIAHTHDDTGYLSTVDEYYESNVRSILTTVTAELRKNPARKFTYVEIAFFAMWWEEQTNATRAEVRRLVAEGQLDFSNGGWCMPDEGGPTYQDLLANMQKGLRFIEREFGRDARPRVAWSIDPFGHSSTYASLNALFGFDFFVVGRIDFQEKAARFATKTMETVWRSSAETSSGGGDDSGGGDGGDGGGGGGSIMTHVLDPIQFYSYPPGFNFEGDKSTWITDENIEARAAQFAAFCKKKAAGYATNSLLVPFGSDFQYTNASINYENMDRLMAFMNTPANQGRFGMALRYSTPAEYMRTLHAYDREWPLKTDDFESYAIGPDQFLVGFYSSRPDYKGFIRLASTQLRAANAALTNARLAAAAAAAAAGAGGGPHVDVSREIAALDIQESALSIAQHHDAITSSQRRHVHRDYISQLSIGQIAVSESASRTVAAALAPAGAHSSTLQPPVLVTCPYLNESSCPATTDPTLLAGEVIPIVLQNPTATDMVQVPVRVPVQGPSTVTSSPTSGTVVSQMLPPWPLAPFVHGGDDQPPKTLHPPSPTVVFLADVPALGTATYFVRREDARQTAVPPPPPRGPDVISDAEGSAVTLDNGILRATFSDAGLLSSLTKGGVTVQVNQSLRYYRGGDGSDSPYAKQGASGSGNYIFQPHDADTLTFTPDGAPSTVSVVLDGAVVSEVRQVFVNGSIEQVFRLYEGSDQLEVEYRIGPIDVQSDGVGKEVISRFDTDIESGDTWRADANGMLRSVRKRDARATLWPDGGPHYFNQTDAVAGNYFAANTFAQIADEGRQLTVLIDRAEGATSLASGQLELMLHRRLTHGCRWGMCEGGEQAGLNDTLGAEVVIRHRLSVDAVRPDGSSPAAVRAAARRLNYPPSVFFGAAFPAASTAASFDGTRWPYPVRTEPLVGALPKSIELTTWQVLDEGDTLMVRFTHMYPPGEHSTLSVPATFSLCGVFGSRLCAAAAELTEVTGAGDAPLASVERLVWKTKGGGKWGGRTTPMPQPPVGVAPASVNITVAPAHIRTFKIALVR